MKYKHYDIILALFVSVLIISNIASAKITALWFFTFDAGTLLFPLSYVLGDILTEVYGFKKARRAIWIGFILTGLLSLTMMAVKFLPPAADWPYQADFENIIGQTPRIVLASLIAFLAGGMSNAFTMARLKRITGDKLLWTRTIGSTLIGEAIDTLLFVFIAFYGLLPFSALTAIIISNYVFKCGMEIILTPATYKAADFLKKEEQKSF